MKRYRLLLPLLLCVLSGCEYGTNLYYRVKNTSTAPITVVCHKSFYGYYADTAVIPPGHDSLIARFQLGIDHLVDNYKETGDTLSRFDYLYVYRNDSLLTGEYFLATNRWVYDKYDKYTAEYQMTVSDADY